MHVKVHRFIYVVTWHTTLAHQSVASCPMIDERQTKHSKRTDILLSHANHDSRCFSL